ncbi:MULTISPECIES: ComC/BlpC family leader-containing pheromone/bacteriocin [unclassified Sphingobacterium]|uniref:ComC/BlpC family leader-containing pheromone/bacteriocin n=1 Tax=unclassified Sphingobacterium TaxID=2609468 RepID=UPI002955ACA4|nr:ComC/BlpC family leader-containing pheromone/bacteriocin [Sphingobacterium sp. UGAL515B_05]WON96661.1 ComC/BlpC family leader-containing pheromone/bacteriocin [Sphingobacterium sp. UGAL515B_05]
MKNLESLNEFEVMNEQEIKTIKGGLVAGSTVESDSSDDDHATTNPDDDLEPVG